MRAAAAGAGWPGMRAPCGEVTRRCDDDGDDGRGVWIDDHGDGARGMSEDAVAPVVRPALKQQRSLWEVLFGAALICRAVNLKFSEGSFLLHPAVGPARLHPCANQRIGTTLV